MKIIFDKPIDIIYEQELKEIAHWYDDWTIEETLKQCISLHHKSIKENTKDA